MPNRRARTVVANESTNPNGAIRANSLYGIAVGNNIGNRFYPVRTVAFYYMREFTDSTIPVYTGKRDEIWKTLRIS